jgi:serine/threonine-protein phosphatase CPPED1
MRKSRWLWTIILSEMVFEVFAAPQMTSVVPSRNKNSLQGFTFAVVGDNQPKGVFGQPEVLKKIISEINRSGVDFTVHLGDRISGNKDVNVVRKQYEEYLGVVKKLNVPIYYTIGNHEIEKVRGNEEIHKDLFGPLYYSFVHKGCLFIVLNTESVGNEGAIEGKQLLWLKEEIEKGKDSSYIFVFFHRPLFSVLHRNKDDIHYISREHRDEIAGLFKKYSVSAVFAGHEHLYHSGIHNGLLQVVSGGGGAPFHFYPEGNFHHFLLVRVTEESATIRCIPASEFAEGVH